MQYKTLTKKLAKEIANKSFGHVLDSILGYTDPYYDFKTDVSEFDTNFQEDLQELGFNPTERRIEMVAKEYIKLRDSFENLIRKKYYTIKALTN